MYMRSIVFYKKTKQQQQQQQQQTTKGQAMFGRAKYGEVERYDVLYMFGSGSGTTRRCGLVEIGVACWGSVSL